ncbi:predicted protein [Lichtheimia corymbifera JMRC:FSU:9682]|uniref:Uncharacterized protein n=1 Tax=Lichtheimia corymbifera JMRC:FSU:9682 TaxID=1263082 RepID=A0A068S8N3_9FUNG|nr:predicted protein [Lichtheimia corymbifera JMRC:FSU:9682]
MTPFHVIWKVILYQNHPKLPHNDISSAEGSNDAWEDVWTCDEGLNTISDSSNLCATMHQPAVKKEPAAWACLGERRNTGQRQNDGWIDCLKQGQFWRCIEALGCTRQQDSIGGGGSIDTAARSQAREPIRYIITCAIEQEMPRDPIQENGHAWKSCK